MAKPVISSTTSIEQWFQFQYWEFQPVASNDPSAWNCSPLPPGMSFNLATGLISGAALQPGVYDVQITATNSDGTSDALEFPIGIAASSGQGQVDGIDLVWDMETGVVTCSAMAALLTQNDGTPPEAIPIAWVKSGDIRMFHITPMKQGVVLPLVFDTLVLNLKEYDDGPVIASSIAFVQVSSGPNNVYRIALDLTQPAIAPQVASALDDHYADAGSNFVALAEIRATYAATGLTPAMDGGPTELVTSSLDFGLGIEAEIAA